MSEQAKFTPGPWRLEMVPTASGTCHKVGPFPSLGVRQETFACVYADNVRADDYGHSKIGDELLANARLIAAAPDLLEAAQLAFRHLDQNDPMRERVAAVLRAAIAAATENQTKGN